MAESPRGHHHHHHGTPARPAGGEAPLDAASQSLADALRTSFSILKFIMLVLVVLYCFSGVQCIEAHEQAVVLRFGRLLPEVREPGLSWAYPKPIDETVRFPTKQSSKFSLKSHWPHLTPEQEARPLAETKSFGGLDPALDGALLTADRGMVHIKWAITYQITNLADFVLNVADRRHLAQRDAGDAQLLVSLVLEDVATAVVSCFTAEEATRGKSTDIARLVKGEVNDRLRALGSGIEVVSLDIPESSVPGQTIEAFNNVTKAENEKQSAIRRAQQDAKRVLNETAGAAHEKLMVLLEEREAAAGDADRCAAVDARISAVLQNEASGRAGASIREAASYYTQVVQQVKGDVQEYEAALPEYLTARDSFVARMWEATRRKVLNYEGVTKHMLFANQAELRINVGPDPRQRDIDETRQLAEEARRRGEAARSAKPVP